MCVGATIDFLAGEKPRAPRWLQRIGCEWLHRVASEPKRLAKRYARDAWIFPRLVLARVANGLKHASLSVLQDFDWEFVAAIFPPVPVFN